MSTIIGGPTWFDYAASSGDAVYPHLWDDLFLAWSVPVNPRRASTLFDLANPGRRNGSLIAMDDNNWQTYDNRQCLLVDGSAEYVTGVATGIAGPPLSLSAWFSPKTGINIYTGILAYGEANSEYTLLTYTPFMWAHVQVGGIGNVYAQSNTGMSYDKLNHAVAVFYSATRREIFINGISRGVDTTTATNADLVSPSCRIGSRNHVSNQLFKGQISEGLIYNRALSAEEIKLLYEIGPGGFAMPRRRVWAFAPIATGEQSYTLNEGITAGDSFTVLQTIQKTLSESVTASDSWSALQQINKALTEGITAGDSWAINLVRLASLTEGATVGDTWSILQTINKLFSESVTVGDNWAFQHIPVGEDSYTLNEGVIAGDTWSTLQQIARLLSQSITAGDDWTTEVVPVGQQSYTLSEGITAADTWAFLQQILKSLAQQATVGDSWSALQTIFKALSEGVTVSDAWIALQAINRTLSAGVTLSDTWSVSTVTGLVNLAEGATVGDNWSIKQTINKLFTAGIGAGATFSAISSGYNIVYTSIVFYAAIKIKSIRFDLVT